jgi:hypothetical protein
MSQRVIEKVRYGACRRSVLSLLSLMVAGVLLAGHFAFAQENKDGKKEKPVDEKTVYSTADGWPLKLTYYKSTEGKDAAVVILLHPKNESRMVWTAKDGFAEMLHKRGFAVIALDLRKHGQSKDKDGTSEEETKKSTTPAADKDKAAKKAAGGSELKPADNVAMIGDVEAVKKMIYEEHQKGHLNMRKTAVVAPVMSAPIAVTFAANDWAKKPYDDASTPAARTPRGQDVQALVLLSPDSNLPGVVPHQAATALKSLPISSLVVVGKNDPADKEQAKKLFQQLGGDPAKSGAAKKVDAKKEKGKEKEAEGKEEKQRHYFIQLDAKLRGTDLLGKKLGLEDAMAGFLKENLQDLKGPFYEWRDRQSRLAE